MPDLAPIYSQPAGIELMPLIDRCIESERARDLSPRSLFELRLHLGRFSDYCREKGVLSFQELDAALLKKFILHTNPSGSPAQGKAIIWTLRKFFSYLALWSIMASNPACALSHPKLSPRHKPPRYLTATQLRTFMTTQVKEMLLDWIVMRKALLHSNCSHALFLSKKGNRLSPRMAEQAFKLVRDTMDNLTIARVVPHTFRHAFASHAIDGEAEVLVLKTIMGHASIKTTEMYLHPSIKSLRKAVADHVSSDILKELKEKRIGVFKIQNRKANAA